MPTYDYVCQSCGETFEVFHSIKDDPLTACLDEKCSGTLKRKIGTGAGIIFKGSGFYETDYRSEGYKKAAKADSEAGKASSSSEKSSGDSGSKASAPAASTSGSSPAKS